MAQGNGSYEDVHEESETGSTEKSGPHKVQHAQVRRHQDREHDVRTLGLSDRSERPARIEQQELPEEGDDILTRQAEREEHQIVRLYLCKIR